MSDYSETFGEARDTKRSAPMRKQQPPKTPIAAFYRERAEVLTHWCAPCRRWHGASCFHNVTTTGGPEA